MTEGVGRRAEIFCVLAYFPNAAVVRGGPIQNQELASSGSPTCVQGPRDLNHSLFTFLGCKLGAGLEVEQLGSRLVPTWFTNAAGRGCACCARTLALCVGFTTDSRFFLLLLLQN